MIAGRSCRLTVAALAFGAGLLSVLLSADEAHGQTENTRWFSSTGYCHGHTTADGTRTRHGVAAAGPAIPFGTTYLVPGYGMATVHDRGGAVHNGVLDLWFDSCAAAWNWGRRWVLVQIINPRPLPPPAPAPVVPQETHEDTAEWSDALGMWLWHRVTRDAQGNVVAELSGVSVEGAP